MKYFLFKKTPYLFLIAFIFIHLWFGDVSNINSHSFLSSLKKDFFPSFSLLFLSPRTVLIDLHVSLHSPFSSVNFHFRMRFLFRFPQPHVFIIERVCTHFSFQKSSVCHWQAISSSFSSPVSFSIHTLAKQVHHIHLANLLNHLPPRVSEHFWLCIKEEDLPKFVFLNLPSTSFVHTITNWSIWTRKRSDCDWIFLSNVGCNLIPFRSTNGWFRLHASDLDAGNQFTLQAESHSTFVVPFLQEHFLSSVKSSPTHAHIISSDSKWSCRNSQFRTAVKQRFQA